MAQKGFYFDMTTCIGCKACQVACKDKNNMEVGALFRRVYTFEGGKYPLPVIYNLSMSCNHCEQPKCVENCPTGAMYKRDDGIVMSDRSKCIGCRLCTWSCPYSAPQYIEKEGKVGKCDLCADLIDKGETPVCVASCVMRAIDYGEIEELRQRYVGMADIKGLPDFEITYPAVVIKPKKEAIK